MARTNKYASLNFNEIFEKKRINKPSPNSSSSSSATNPQTNHLSNARIHGGMLVLTRPSPKPHSQSQPQPQPQSQSQPQPQPHQQLSSPPPSLPSKSESDQTLLEPDSISLRPLGRTRTGSSFISSPSSSSSSSSTPTLSLTLEREREIPPSLPLAKPEPFVPPHLRQGFIGREERLELDRQRHQGFRSSDNGQGQGQYRQQNSSTRYSEDGRPKSGGHEWMRRSGDSDLSEMNRPSSGGNRPSSGGNRPSSGGWYGSYRSPPHF